MLNQENKVNADLLVTKFQLPVKHHEHNMRVVFASNGYEIKNFKEAVVDTQSILVYLEENNIHCYSIFDVFLKDGRISVFSNWGCDKNGKMIKPPKFIEGYDITKLKDYDLHWRKDDKH